MKAFRARRSRLLRFVSLAAFLSPVLICGTACAQGTRDGTRQGQPTNAQVIQRWEQEWQRENPGKPLPNLPTLERLHRGKIISNVNTGFDQMRAQRQQDLREERAMNRRYQEQLLAKRGITWNAQQWAQWNRDYDADKKAQADAWAAEQARLARWDHYWRYGW